MATKFRVYAGDQIVFYSSTLGDKSATLSLDSEDILQIGASIGGQYSGEISTQKLGIAEVIIASKVSGAGVWNAGTITYAYGGTGLTSYASGDIIYASAANTLSALAKGSNGAFLNLSAGLPRWGNTIAAGGLTISEGGASITGNVGITGNLTVTGNFTQTTINTYNMAVSDNAILLNTPAPASPNFDSGIQIDIGANAPSGNRYMVIGTKTDAGKWYIGATNNLLGLTGTFTATHIAELATVGQWSDGSAQPSQAIFNKTFSSTNVTGLTLTPGASTFNIQGGSGTARTLTVNTGNITLSASGKTLTLATNLTANTGDLVLQANASGTTAIFPATGTITLVDLGTVQNITSSKTFTNGIVLNATGGGSANAGNITGTGTYQAGTITVTYGGTGSSTFNQGGLLFGNISSSTGSVGSLTAVAVGSVLQSNGLNAAPQWNSNLSVSGSITSGTTVSVGTNLIVSNAGSAGQTSFISGWTGAGWNISGSAFPTTTVRIITGAVRDTPIVNKVRVTSTAHGFLSGQIVTIASVVGMTAINGVHKIMDVEPNHFYIAVATTQTYTSGGTATPVAAGLRATAEFDNLTVRGNMRIYELLIQQIRATNGSIFVSSTAKITSATLLTGTNVGDINSTYTMTVASGTNHGFFVNDIIRAQRWITGTAIYQIDMQVTAVASMTVFTATLITASDYLLATGISGFNDTDFVRLGNTSNTARQGSVYMTSDDTGAPFIDILNGVSAHSGWNAVGNVKVRLGRLDGITDAALGLVTNNGLYGLYSDSVYLKGNLIVGSTGADITLANGTIAIGKIIGNPTTGNTGIKIAMTGNLTTSGIFGYSSGTALAFSLPLAGTATIAGWNFDATRIFTTNVVISSATTAAVSGNVIISGGDARVYVGSGVTLDGATTGGIRVGTTVLLDGASTGKLAIGANASALSMTVGTGFYADGVGNFKAGTAATHGIFWDGTTFNVRANSVNVISAIAGSATICGWTATATQFFNSFIRFSTTTTPAVSGNVIISGGDARVYVGSGVTLDGATTGGIRVGTTVLLDGASTGKLAIGANASALSMTVGTGFYADGVGNFKAGTAATHGIFWDGTTFNVRANSVNVISAIAGSATIAGWYFDNSTLWAGNPAKFDTNTTIYMIQSATPVNAMIKLGPAASAITIAGTEAGIAMDGAGNIKIYNDADNYIRKNGAEFYIASNQFSLKGGTTLVIDTSKIALGASASSLSLTTGTGVYIHNTGHFKAGSPTAFVKWDGTNFTWAGADNSLSALGLTITNATIAGWTINNTSIFKVAGIGNIWMSPVATLTGYNTANATGIWLGSDSKFRVGTINIDSILTKGIIFDGTDLVINSTSFKLDTSADKLWATQGGFGNNFEFPAVTIGATGLNIGTSLYVTNGSTWRQPAIGSNLISNGDFEASLGAGNWTASTTPSGSAAPTRGGAGFGNMRGVSSAAVGVGGTGYAVGDLLYINGTSGTPATVKVVTLSGSAVSTVTVIKAGTGYTANSTYSTTAITGSGFGATLTITRNETAGKVNSLNFTNLNTSVYQIVTITAPAQLELSFAATVQGSFGITVNIYKRISAGIFIGMSNTSFALVASKTFSVGSTWTEYSMTYYATDTSDLAIEFIYSNWHAEAQPINLEGVYVLRLDDVALYTYAGFTELNSQGLQVYVSPNNYLRLGKTGSQFNITSLQTTSLLVSSDLTVFGNLNVYGNHSIIGQTVVTSTIQTLNSGGSTPTTIAGLMIDGTSTGGKTLFFDYASGTRWKIGTYTSPGGAASTIENIESIITNVSADTFTGVKTFNPGTLRLMRNVITTLQGNENSAPNCTIVLPRQTASSDTLMSLASVDTISGVKTFNAGTLAIFNSDASAKTIFATNVITTDKIITFPNATDIVTVLGTAQTFTALKTFHAGVTIANNSALIVSAGGSVSFPTGSVGNAALATINTAGKVTADAITAGGTFGLSTISGTNNDMAVDAILGSAYYIGTNKLRANAVYRSEVIVGSSGISAGVAIPLPNSQTYRLRSVVGTTGNNSTMIQWLQVFVDGRLQRARYGATGVGTAFDYEETSTSSVTFSYPLPENTYVTFIVYAG